MQVIVNPRVDVLSLQGALGYIGWGIGSVEEHLMPQVAASTCVEVAQVGLVVWPTHKAQLILQLQNGLCCLGR